FLTYSGYCFTGIEALGLLLAQYRSPGNLKDLAIMYNQSESAISQVVGDLSQWINWCWSFLLDFDADTGILTSENINLYADVISRAGAPLDSVWGFLNCTIHAMCQPIRQQQEVYNGYKKVHSLKYQALIL
ncbi:hypothetical protein P691DRAFT_646338, partial [Macrolepiota fuliginosa MF-IS2]